jgi:3-methyl-2-oxobutanoate hydroxymethyltransferase
MQEGPVNEPNEQPAPYGSGAAPTPNAGPNAGPAGGPAAGPRKIRIHHLRQLKERGEKWAMLTAYDQFSASIFDQAGIPVLLVGDSAANNVFGYTTTIPVTLDEMIPLVRAVSRSAQRALVIADLPFGTYQAGPQQALATSVRMMKEGLAHAVKVEGGAHLAPSVAALTQAGIPVMAHVGFTPQSEHALGGYRVQGRGDAAERMVQDALVLQEAGAFAIVLEMVPAPVAAQVTKALDIPTIGIGAGADTDAQVLVWTDMAGLGTGKGPRFVKRYADLRSILTQAATDYADEVRSGVFPAAEHSFQE